MVEIMLQNYSLNQVWESYNYYIMKQSYLIFLPALSAGSKVGCLSEGKKEDENQNVLWFM